MTFSIVALDPDNGDLGVAVQSKFPNAGVAMSSSPCGVLERAKNNFNL